MNFNIGDRVPVIWDRIPENWFGAGWRNIKDYRNGSSVSYGTVKKKEINGPDLLLVSMDSVPWYGFNLDIAVRTEWLEYENDSRFDKEYAESELENILLGGQNE